MKQAKNENDTRILRSKRDLANALEELLQEKNLDDISINEIAQKALVSKNTFYNNFLDKNELVMYLFQRYLDEISIKIDKVIEKGNKNKELLFKECIKEVVHYLYRNPIGLISAIKHDVSKTLFWNLNMFLQSITSYIISKYKQLFTKDVPDKISGIFYGGAIANSIYFFSLDDVKMDEDEAVDYMYQLIVKPCF